MDKGSYRDADTSKKACCYLCPQTTRHIGMAVIGDPVMARMLLAEKEEEVEAEFKVAFPGLQMVNAGGESLIL